VDFSIDNAFVVPLAYNDGIERSASLAALSRVCRSRIFLDKDLDFTIVGDSVAPTTSDCSLI